MIFFMIAFLSGAPARLRRLSFQVALTKFNPAAGRRFPEVLPPSWPLFSGENRPEREFGFRRSKKAPAEQHYEPFKISLI
jgi:hypothetical protein